MKVERSYEIANISLTLETSNKNYFVVINRGGKTLAHIFYGDSLHMATSQFELFERLIPALIERSS